LANIGNKLGKAFICLLRPGWVGLLKWVYAKA